MSSVVKSKRKETKSTVITKADELAAYTVHICSNEKYFPKRYRWCITAKIVNTAIDISTYAHMANPIYVGGDLQMLRIRKSLQTKTYISTFNLLSLINIAYNTFHIDGRRVEYWTGLVIELQEMIKNWTKSLEQSYQYSI
jgi:hypothetical protein